METDIHGGVRAFRGGWGGLSSKHRQPLDVCEFRKLAYCLQSRMKAPRGPGGPRGPLQPPHAPLHHNSNSTQPAPTKAKRCRATARGENVHQQRCRSVCLHATQANQAGRPATSPATSEALWESSRRPVLGLLGLLEGFPSSPPQGYFPTLLIISRHFSERLLQSAVFHPLPPRLTMRSGASVLSSLCLRSILGPSGAIRPQDLIPSKPVH